MSFFDIYVEKKFGEPVECEECTGSGLVQYGDQCTVCEGKGFLLKEDLTDSE